MKKFRNYVGLFLVLTVLTVSIVGCGEKVEEIDENAEFSYSESIDDNGMFKGIKALDYVELANIDEINVPKESHEIKKEDVQAEIDSMLTSFVETKEIKDRKIKKDDLVNIDYVGSVGGVEFEGGNTNGQGTEVTAGSENYIDDFLVQIIGHKPGETFDVKVTFPDEYPNNPDLAGKDAVFVTTINFIAEKVDPKLDDKFVEKNFKESNGWTTVDQMKKEIEDKQRTNAIKSFVQSYITEGSKVDSRPDSLMNYQERAMKSYYEDAAKQAGKSLEEYIKESSNNEMSSFDDLKEKNKENIETQANTVLIMQAIAEKLELAVNEQDVADFFKNNYSTDDFSQYEEQYGMPYLKQAVLFDRVISTLADKATLK